MTAIAGIEIRPARRADTARLMEFLHTAPVGPGDPGSASIYLGDLAGRLVAVAAGEIVGSILYTPGAGHCAAIYPPRLMEWDQAVAAGLCRAAAARAHRKHAARLIQSLVPPEADSPLARALERAGFEPLATLSYMRRAVEPADRGLEPPPGLVWLGYSRLRHRKFADTIARTYEGSLDCPGLAGLRPIGDSIATHKHTGVFTPKAWRLALTDGRPLGVVMVNNLQGRGELTYLGVVPEARGRGTGRALVDRAIRDTAEMGLPQMGLAADVSNEPAMRLYAAAGFKEIRRRLAYFVPGARLDALATE